jgi:3-keto-5-aminohexanoate cleavage enzyme
LLTAKEVYAGFKTTIDKEPPLTGMKKKLIINVAPTGSFTMKDQNPWQPVTMEENVNAVVDSYRAGASLWHVHARAEDGLPTKDPKIFKETIDRVFDKCPDIVTSVIPYADYGSQGVDQIKPMVDYLTGAGPQYMRSAPLFITTVSFSQKFAYIVTKELLTSVVKYLDEHNVKAEFQGINYSGLKDVYDWIMEPGIAGKPYVFNLMAGFHGFNHLSPCSPDPWNYVYLMSLQQTIPSGAVMGFCAGGRNWLPFTAMAIVLGFDIVRVGMEDAIYMYPYSEEPIKSCADIVSKVAIIARELGRDVATPKEARQIMGLT